MQERFDPIETVIATLGTTTGPAIEAMTACSIRIDEAAPLLRAAVIRAANGTTLSEAEATIVFRALHILAAARDTQICEPLLRLVSLPIDQVEYLLGDGITETLSRIVVSVFDGDARALFDTILRAETDVFVGGALLGAATFLTWESRIDRQAMVTFLRDFDRLTPPEKDDYVWVAWLEAIGLLNLRDLRPLADRAWEDGRLSDDYFERDWLDTAFAEAALAPDDIGRFGRESLGYIDDPIQALWWVDWYADLGGDREDEDRPWADPAFLSPEPVVNPWRHVGRNDPCPCGSGKKAKKCCLSA